MTPLKVKIRALLLEVCSEVYHIEAPVSAMSPYVIYDVIEAVCLDGMYVCDLDVDLWDKGKSSNRIEALAAQVVEVLHRTTHIDETLQFTVYHEKTLNPQPGEKGWQRRLLRFEIRYMERRRP